MIPAKPRKAFKGTVAFSVNTAMCRSEVELIQHVIDLNGFGESQSLAALGNLVWYGLALHPKDIEVLLKRKSMPYFNRYPGLEQLARKKTFCSIVNRMRKTFPQEVKFCPRSFQLPEESEELEQYMKDHPKFTFIAKPSRGRGGEGIMLVQKFGDLPKNWNVTGYNDLLVQRYIKKPLLVDK